MPDARERPSERLADVVHEIVVAEASVAQPRREDDEVGEKVGRAERVRVDEDGAEDSWVVHAREERRIQRDDLVVDRADARDLDAGVEQEA